MTKAKLLEALSAVAALGTDEVFFQNDGSIFIFPSEIAKRHHIPENFSREDVHRVREVIDIERRSLNGQ